MEKHLEEGEREFYNCRYQCPDPLAKNAVNRSTRHRILKKRRLTDNLLPTIEQELVTAADDDVEEAIDLQQSMRFEDAEVCGDSEAACKDIESISSCTSLPPESVLTEGDMIGDYFSSDLVDCVGDRNDDFDIGEEDSEEEDDDLDVEDDHSTSVSAEKALFEGSPLTQSASNILVMKFKMRHKLTKECLSDLLKLIKLHCSTTNFCCQSMYFFEKQLMTNLNQPACFHSFCSSCYAEVESFHTRCPNPDCNISLKDQDRTKSYFIEVSLESQLTSILERKDFLEVISSQHLLHNDRHQDGIYEDICDGAVYQKLVSAGFLLQPANLTLMLNTDGVPVFKSSSFSFWPLHLVINELPFSIRFSKENRLLGGLWYGCNKPDMTLFLKPLSKSLTKLYDEGIVISPPGKSPCITKVALVCVTCDLPAKALVLNSVQFNGFYGCSHCLQKGKTLKVGARGRVHIYPYQEENPTGPVRTDIQTRSSARDALSMNEIILGVKGPSCLGTVPTFDLVQGMSCDYMHSVLLGVTRILLRLWMDSKFHGESWYLGTAVRQLDNRLCKICPPCEIQRTPRSIENTLKFWKAHELRAWLLHYSPVVLAGYLDEDYYQHHLLLVEAVYLLLKDKVSDQDIIQSERLLKHYCFLLAPLYGDRYLTGSVHGLLHLPEAVRNLGPLWAHSCFGFESSNGDLLKLFHGSQGIEKQIISHIGALQILPEVARSSLAAGTSEDNFFHEMCTSKGRRRPTVTQTCGVGKPHSEELTTSEKELFSKYGVLVPASQVITYRAVFIPETKRTVSTRTSRQTLRDNSCFIYSTVSSATYQYALLKKVVVFDSGEAFAIALSMSCASRRLCKDSITDAHLDAHLVVLNPPRDMTVVCLNLIQDKCVFMDLVADTGFAYASLFHNSKEYD